MSYKLNQYTSEGIQQEERSEDFFWLEYYPKLQRYCHFLTQNKWDGDDIAQEAYLKAKKYDHHRQKLTSALLNKIAYNHWIDTLRKRKNETIEADFDLASNQSITQLDSIINTVEILLKKLTPKQAIILVLKEAFQYQVKEIAAILDTSEMAVKSNLHRAKKRLEKDLQEEKTSAVDSFWVEEVRQQLSDLFYKALTNQDPTILIRNIPLLKSIAGVPKLVSGNLQSIQTHTPLGALCMAA
ncbi:sigma-70 family RNA polymerase sigma factor [Neobacillus pocheonensis]|uniref:Sigma-70 family RNA polymerase sigma factor n=1 Tax=Neobacillus pocheonensis TaxID=363869 RepID=A0ABT0WC31_9BACI|nr:sigma-70 family RNA polymerase sigma factor [Neobacillus pocheonensis]